MSPGPQVAGFDGEALQRAGRMVATVEGMWCASCAMAVERIITRAPGVTRASTSFAGGSALIQWDPARFQLDELLERVERLGYRLVPLVEADVVDQQIDQQAHVVWLRLAVAVFFGMWSMLGALALYIDPILAASSQGWWVAFGATVMSIPVATYSALPFYRAGWRTLRAGVPGMDALISLGVLAAMLLSAWRLWQHSTEVYVDTATMLVGFLLCGRLIELYARRRNSDAVSALRQAVPEIARKEAADGTATEVPVPSLQVGDVVLIYAGERISVDGCLLTGESEIDRALVNGESAPAFVQPGDQVEAGCINLSSVIRVRVEQPYGKRFIDRIGIRILELCGAKSMMAMQAERFARLLVPSALGLAVLIFVYTWSVERDAASATLRALSVLVAACPCAVGLALPLTYAASAGSAARQGILFRDPASMEALARCRSILFDKTGTLTNGRLEVVNVVAPECGRRAALQWAALAESGIAHPIAVAIRSAASTEAIKNSYSGKAQRGTQGARWQSDNGKYVVLVGSRSWFATHGVDMSANVLADAQSSLGTDVHVALNQRWIATLHLRDVVLPEAATVVDALRKAGIEMRLVTGDAAGAAVVAAESVGLAPRSVHAGCLPEEKIVVLDQVPHPAVFVGDGINDALALAAADCGIAVQGASTAAVATAGVVIAGGGLINVVAAWRHARYTFAIVRQNLLFSIIYNIIILVLAVGGAVPPVAAAVAMLASSISMGANATRLTRFRG